MTLFHFNLGTVFHALGQAAEAVSCYQQAVALDPSHAGALHNLGNLLKDGGNLSDAIACYRQALHINPNQAETHYNLGLALVERRELAEAVSCFRHAVRLNPDHAGAFNDLGNALKDQGQADEAIACYRRALRVDPHHPDAHANLALALFEGGDLEEAALCYVQALRINPNHANAHNNLGLAFSAQGKLDEAVAYYRRALALKPDYAEAYSNLGNALKGQRKWEEAVGCYHRALELKPDYAEAHSNLGNALADQGKLEEAIKCYHRALQLKPDYVDAHLNLGCSFCDQGKLDEAFVCYRRALALKPDFADAHWNHSLLMLLTGDFERGWAEYEWRWQTKLKYFQPRGFSQPLWDGRPLAGRTILLHDEQGLGDTIQFVRYAPLVKERVGTVLFECHPRLLPLLKESAGIDQIVARGAPLPPFDVRMPLLSVPAIFGSTLVNIPAPVPYLRADSERIAYWAKELAGLRGLRIGIAWQGDSDNTKDRQRSVSLAQFEPLAQVNDVRLVSLQKGPGAGQLHALAGRLTVFDLGDRLDAEAAFIDTAAVMMNLDLIVAVDTAVAHLAGALGVPVWLALPFVPDWRWLLEREDSPWYPQHRLFRQKRPGDWSEVFERIAGALAELVKNRTAGR